MVPDLLDPFRYADGTPVRCDTPNEEPLHDAAEQEVEAFWNLLARTTKREDSSDTPE